MDRRNRIDHAAEHSAQFLDIGSRIDNVLCHCIHKELSLVLRPSDPGPHRTQITNRRFTTFSHSSLRRFDFTPLCHDQLILRTLQRITQRRQHLQTNAARWRCDQPIHLLPRQLNASLANKGRRSVVWNSPFRSHNGSKVPRSIAQSFLPLSSSVIFRSAWAKILFLKSPLTEV